LVGKNVMDDITHYKKLDETCFVDQRLLCNIFLVTSHAQSTLQNRLYSVQASTFGKTIFFFIFIFPFKFSRQLLDGDVGP